MILPVGAVREPPALNNHPFKGGSRTFPTSEKRQYSLSAHSAMV